MIDVFIADDHAVVREGLKRILATNPDIQVTGEASDGATTLREARTGAWDVLLLDLSMPGRSGLDTLRVLKQVQPDLQVLILTIHSEAQLAVRLLQAGASGYLTKECTPNELVKAVRQVAKGRKYVSATLAEILAERLDFSRERPRHEILSDREFQVLTMLANGVTPSEIARRLSLSVKTISTYRSRILEKLQLKSTTDIVRYAFQQRLVD